MRVPATVVAVPLLAGAWAGVLLIDSAPHRLIEASACAAVLCLLAAMAFLADEQPLGLVVAVAAGAALGGYSSGASTTRALLAPSLLQWFDATAGEASDPVLLEGVLRDDAVLLPYGAVLIVDVSRVQRAPAPPEARQGGVRLVVSGAQSGIHLTMWRAGRIVRAPALLRRPATFSNPGVADDRRALALRRVILTGSIKSAGLVEVTAPAGWLSQRAASVRAWTRRTIARHVGRLDPRSAAVATAILIGDRSGLSDEDERRLQDAGTYHVIAISGGNIAILTAVLIFGSRALRMPHRTAAATSIAILVFYGEIAGGTPSVERAITAAVIFLVAMILDHRGSPLNVVAVAATIAVALWPVTTVDGGFLLSFGATAGIVLGVPRIVSLVSHGRGSSGRRALRGVLTAASGVAVATLCAEIALLPVSASLFSRVTFAGLLLNFAAIPLMTAIQCGSMALLAAATVWTPGADRFGWLVHQSVWALVESARLVDVVPWLARDVPPPAVWLCVTYYLACLALLVVNRYKRLLSGVLLGSGLVLVAGPGIATRGIVPRPPAGVLRVVVLDVGQGDATAALLPDGRAILVDAGGLAGTAFDIGTRVVVPALRALGVRELHALVLTHGDPDHVDGAAAVLRRLAVASVWEGIPVPPHRGLAALVSLAEERRTVWRTVRPTDVERAGGVEVRVHHPPQPDWERQRVRNDDSVVLELRYGRVSILLPGDIGRETEVALIPHLDLAPLVILKAAHHGSATSSGDAFIDATTPQAVIFSAGQNNRFGHPAAVVVERFARRGVEMFNTATDGAVFVETDGRRVDLRGWRTGRRLVEHGEHKGHEAHQGSSPR
ncbi:MAG: DNA internalization-related competence protein ComEC/Rec2 [Acidobacteria bacterium]|nr:DNA internalization-related competence protein ComEC/Rec2 [Acidobacteriota bacterium]